jgi:hypothetical protein
VAEPTSSGRSFAHDRACERRFSRLRRQPVLSTIYSAGDHHGSFRGAHHQRARSGA